MKLIASRHLWSAAAVILFTAAASARAQITLDGSMGTGGALTGPNYSIPHTVGRTVGNNLFHSFGQFNLANGEVATFTGPDAIQNVLARVTGGSASTINGTLACTIPGANFFLINPFGVIFGPNAQINVSGSFVATTADHVKLADGGRFDARTPANDILTAAPVSAFGFLTATPASIQINGPTGDQSASTLIQTEPGKTVALIGGDIQMSNVNILAPDGRVAMISAASAGELPFNVDDLTTPVDAGSFSKLGHINLTDFTYVDVSGNDGGRIDIQAADFTLENYSSLWSHTYDVGNGLGIAITARAAINILNSTIWAAAWSDGNGGDVSLSAPVIRVDGLGVGSSISADTAAGGKSGSIFITANTFEVVNAGQITASASDAGNGGDIHITAHSILMDGNANMSVQSLGGTGNAGNIYLSSTDSLTLNNWATIASDTYGPGKSGNIFIQTGTLKLTLESLINASSEGDGPGGSIQINASSILLDRTGSEAQDFGIAANAWNAGKGGNITIITGNLELRGGAAVTTSCLRDGDAGNINIQAGNITLTGYNSRFITPSSIQSATSRDATGKAGNVTLEVTDTLRIQDQANVSVSATHNDGGDIQISAGSKILLDHGFITAQASGNGGNIFLTTPYLLYLLDSKITAQSTTGNGGNVTIDPLFVILNNSQIIASAITGNGGNITITANNLLASDSLFDASSEFGLQGHVTLLAPDVNLAGCVLDLPDNLLDASSQLRPECAIRLPIGASTLIVTGPGGPPVTPDNLLPVFWTPHEK